MVKGKGLTLRLHPAVNGEETTTTQILAGNSDLYTKQRKPEYTVLVNSPPR